MLFPGQSIVSLRSPFDQGSNARADTNGEEFGSASRVDDLNEARYNHTLTLLENGNLMVVGGTKDGQRSLGSVEIYDPTDEEWTITTDLSNPRMRHTSTLLASGDVLIVGGYSGDGNGHPSLYKHFNGPGNFSLSSCEIFDSTTGSLTIAPSLELGRFWHGAVVLADGKVLIIGGLNVTHGVLGSCEIYDPVSNQWTNASPLIIPRVRFTTTILENGSVLVTGGHTGQKKEPFASCELYVPEQDRWYEVSPMNRGRGYHAGVILADGRLLVSGGFASKGFPDWSDSELYDPASDNWILTGNLSLPRHNHVMTGLDSGEVLVIGGSNSLTGGGHSGIEYFNPKTEEWAHTNLIILGLKWTTAIQLHDGRVLVNGGKEYNTASNVTYLYVPTGWGEGDADEEEWDMDGFVAAIFILSIIIIVGTFALILSQSKEKEAAKENKVKEAAKENKEKEATKQKRERKLDVSHFLVIALGTIVVIQCSPQLAGLYLLITGVGIIWFWRTICPHCKGFASPACPSGYGMISSKYFQRPEVIDFKRAFNRNIISVALQWFIPLIAGIGCLYDSLDLILVVSLMIFILVAFIWLPMTSKKKGCAKCPQRGECGWVAGKERQHPVQ